MTKTTTTAKDRLIAAMSAMGIDMTADTMIAAIANLTDAQAQESLDSMAKADAAKADLRDRLMADQTLRVAVCPANTYMTADDRYSIAVRAIRILEAYAAKYAAKGVTVDNLAATLVAHDMTIQHTIDMHGTDPRMDSYSINSGGFYAFNCRVRDARDIITADADRAAHIAREAKRDAAWKRAGMHRCQRCGGAGGHKMWPGFTCFECGGHGATPGVID